MPAKWHSAVNHMICHGLDVTRPHLRTRSPCNCWTLWAFGHLSTVGLSGPPLIINGLRHALLCCGVQNPDDLLFSSDAFAEHGSYVSGQIFYTAFQARFGHGGGGVVAMGIPAIAMFLCCCSSVTSNSRHGPPIVTGQSCNSILYVISISSVPSISKHLPLLSHQTVAIVIFVLSYNSISSVNLHVPLASPGLSCLAGPFYSWHDTD